MTDVYKTKKELYENIRTSSKDEVILEEMIRLGFWKEQTDGEGPSDPAAELRRIGELERQLQQLATQGTRLQNIEVAKAELLKRRLAESRQKRIETKQRREALRVAKAAAWAKRKQEAIVYLGDGVSTALGKHEGRAKDGLPNVQDGPAIAKAMGISLGALRFLTFHRRVSATNHWRRFQIPKKTGGLRRISAPMPRLKAAQHWVLREILEKVPIHDAAHGFVAGRSIVTNARPHVGNDVVVNFDLRDFFPTLDFRRVRGVFVSLGYSPEAATILGLLCTEPEVDEVEIDGRRWFVHTGERKLPQGSPCSPAITNVVCVRLDQRLSGLARKLGLTYTRYADDLTFSGGSDALKTLMGAVRAIVEDEGFEVRRDKTRIMRKGRCQEVTGLVVNRSLGVSRHLLRRWRAVMFQVARDGPEGKRLGPSSDVLASLQGFASFVQMVTPEKGQPMLQAAREAAKMHGWTGVKPEPPPEPAPAPPSHATTTETDIPPQDAAPQEPKARAGWWQFWKW